MAHPRVLHSATLLNSGRVLVAGGISKGPPGLPGCAVGCETPVLEAELYEPDGGTWTLVPGPMRAALSGPGRLLGSGRVLFAGGYEGLGPATSTAELYDPESNRFVPTGPMAEARGWAATAVLASGEVLAAGGGSDFSDGGLVASSERYDPGTGTWRSAASNPFHAPSGRGVAVLASGEVLVSGIHYWENHTGARRPRSALYDPAEDAWTEEYTTTARYWPVLLRLTSGAVLALGGCNGAGAVERFESDGRAWDAANPWDGLTGWLPARSLGTPHAGCGLDAAVLGDGSILVTGGFEIGDPAPLVNGLSQSTATAERYVP
jgi:hypothetical protein